LTAGTRDGPGPWQAAAERAPAVLGWAAGVGALTVVFLILSGREARWLVGLAVLVVVLTLLAMVGDRKRFLLCLLLASVTIRTTINLWMPGPTPYSTGSGTTTTAVELFAFDPALILLSLYLFLGRKSRPPKDFRITDIAAVAFLLFCAASLVNSAYPDLTLVRLPVMARMPLVYYCLSRGVTSRRDLKTVAAALIALVAAQSALAIAQTAFGSFDWINNLVKRDDQLTVVALNGSDVVRATGTVGYTTVFAQWLGLLSPVALAFAAFGRPAAVRLGAGVAYITALVAVVLSVSRAEWINVPIVVGALLVIWMYKQRSGGLSRGLGLAALVAVMAIVVALQHDLIVARLTSPDSESAYIRLPMMKVAARVISQNPFFGVGLHNYTQVMRSYGLAELIPGWDFGVHNSFLYLLAEAGIFALLTLLFLWAAAFKRLLVCLSSRDQVVWTLAAGMICGLIALFIHSQVEEGFHIHQVLNATLWAFFGLAAAMPHVASQAPAARL